MIETFGDSSELADELIAFVVDGPKRATAGLVAEFERFRVVWPAELDQPISAPPHLSG